MAHLLSPESQLNLLMMQFKLCIQDKRSILHPLLHQIHLSWMLNLKYQPTHLQLKPSPTLQSTHRHLLIKWICYQSHLRLKFRPAQSQIYLCRIPSPNVPLSILHHLLRIQSPKSTYVKYVIEHLKVPRGWSVMKRLINSAMLEVGCAKISLIVNTSSQFTKLVIYVMVRNRLVSMNFQNRLRGLSKILLNTIHGS